MALLKEIPTHFGVPATYWRITRASYDVDERRVGYTVAGYLSEDARIDDGAPIMETTFEILEIDDPDEITREMLYEHAKKQGYFGGAEDI